MEATPHKHEEQTDLDRLCIDTIRTLSMDAVQKANSGHPGHADGAGAARLRALHARHAATTRPTRTGRTATASCSPRATRRCSCTRPSTSPATASRSTTSRTSASSAARRAGHPEYGHAPGIETTTGPLGQGIANAVGLALAERMLAARFNRAGHEIVDHHTYVDRSDGDLKEGVQSEASSLAGHLGLGRLIAFYDDNHISIEGDTALAFTEDVAASATRPTAGTCRTSARTSSSSASRRRSRPRKAVEDQPVADHRAHAHRARRAEQAGHRGRARLAARRGGDPAHQGGLRLAVRRSRSSCPTRRSSTSASRPDRGEGAPVPSGRSASPPTRPSYPELAAELERTVVRAAARRLGRRRCPRFHADDGTIATRKASRGDPVGGRQVPELVGGSADLAPSTLTPIDGAGDVEHGDYGGPQLPLRHPRARHGRDRQRPGLHEPPRLRRRPSSSSPTT